MIRWEKSTVVLSTTKLAPDRKNNSSRELAIMDAARSFLPLCYNHVATNVFISSFSRRKQLQVPKITFDHLCIQDILLPCFHLSVVLLLGTLSIQVSCHGFMMRKTCFHYYIRNKIPVYLMLPSTAMRFLKYFNYVCQFHMNLASWSIRSKPKSFHGIQNTSKLKAIKTSMEKLPRYPNGSD